MILFRFITKWSLYFVACVAILSSCRHSRISSEEEYEDEIVHADMLYFDFDSVNDLSQFLDSISNEHWLPIRNFVWEESAQKEICCCINRLEGYRNGKSKYYPDNLIRECINTLSHECALLANHESELDMTYAEWFLMLAAYYSPDITCLVHMHPPPIIAQAFIILVQDIILLHGGHIFSLKERKGLKYEGLKITIPK